jgi:hypothetical protein
MTAFLAAFFISSFQGPVMSVQEEDEGFKALFDGISLKGWKGYKQPQPPGAWRVENGELVSHPGDSDGDISTAEQYTDFDLRLEWNTERGGNSGVIYRSGDDYEASSQTGPEYQLFDDFQSDPKGRKDVHSAGALYDLYAPSKFVTRKAGDWNETRIVVRGNHFQHYLNGTMIVDCQVGSKDWRARVTKSKFTEWPLFATKNKGYILLQDHGHAFRFRRLRIKEL